MGYDLHITRAENWFDNSSYEITSQEWLELVSNDPELTLESISGAYFTKWSGECSYPWGAWFDWSEGNVYTKNPDQSIFIKTLQIASILNAKAQGDDGEVYRSLKDFEAWQ